MPPTHRHIHSRLALYGRGANLGNTLQGEELIKKMTAYIKKQVKENNRAFVGIARGDVVILDTDAGYRNNGTFIWNGKKVLFLYTEVDDYGSLPPEIEIADDNDFTAYSWEDLLDHNSLVWYSPEIRDRIKDGLNENLQSRVNIRQTSWTFYIDASQTRPTVEEVKRALDENRVIFNARNNNNIEMFVSSNQVHGTPRRRARTASTRTTARSRANAAATAAEEERQRAASTERRRVANITRIETELRAARATVADLERQLANMRTNNGGKAKSNKK
jgi:hypothetical protein